MVKVKVGDIFESKAQTLVNTVNCVGVMGKGIALEFKKRFPAMYKDYVHRCERGEVKLGIPYLYKTTVLPWIINFPTKDHWRSLAKLEDIIQGLEYLISHYKEWGITSLAMPPLGSGLGQLEWSLSGPVLYQYLSKMDINVELYAPYETPEDELKLSFLKSKIHPGQFPLSRPEFAWLTPAWFALVEILKRIEDQPYHPPVGRTSFQKMAYAAKYIGIPLDINFVKGSYGPFSPELKQKISRLLNNKLIKEETFGQMIKIMVDSSYTLANQIYLPEIQQWDDQIKKVSDLFMRVDTKQAEVIATVIYAEEELRAQSAKRPTEAQVVNAVMQWKELRRPPLVETYVANTVRNLAALGWLNVKASPDLKIQPEPAF